MRDRLFNLIRSDPMSSEDDSPRISTNSNSDRSVDNSPYSSPKNMASSPFVKSPWSHSSAAVAPLSDEPSSSSLVGSMIREHGHLYSIATANGLLYTGSDSKNIRVWRNLAEYSGFKSGSGLVKAIVISGEKIFTGHQDGKVRIWKVSPKDPSVHKRIGTLPSLKDFLKSSINPSAYVHVRRHRNAVWLRHFDAVSSLSLDEEAGILYSGSWDKTFKAWRVSDSRCLESVSAHEDAINSLVAFNGLVFTGSADGMVKVWRREVADGKSGSTKHVLISTLLNQESAVTALAVSPVGNVVYGGSSDGAINCWEVGSRGRTIVPGGTIRGHKMAVLCLATAGRLVVSGSADWTIRVWRREVGGTHTRVSVLTGHTGPVKCLAVEEEEEDGGGWVLYSGSLDKSVKVWRVAEGDKEPHVMKTKKRT